MVAIAAERRTGCGPQFGSARHLIFAAVHASEFCRLDDPADSFGAGLLVLAGQHGVVPVGKRPEAVAPCRAAEEPSRGSERNRRWCRVHPGRGTDTPRTGPAIVVLKTRWFECSPSAACCVWFLVRTVGM